MEEGRRHWSQCGQNQAQVLGGFSCLQKRQLTRANHLTRQRGDVRDSEAVDASTLFLQIPPTHADKRVLGQPWTQMRWRLVCPTSSCCWQPEQPTKLANNNSCSTANLSISDQQYYMKIFELRHAKLSSGLPAGFSLKYRSKYWFFVKIKIFIIHHHSPPVITNQGYFSVVIWKPNTIHCIKGLLIHNSRNHHSKSVNLRQIFTNLSNLWEFASNFKF